eukprot:9612-Chlamydomonas_euryale.AAC.1
MQGVEVDPGVATHQGAALQKGADRWYACVNYCKHSEAISTACRAQLQNKRHHAWRIPERRCSFAPRPGCFLKFLPGLVGPGPWHSTGLCGSGHGGTGP